MLSKWRWEMASLLFLAGIINYLDRAALSVQAPLASRDLHLGSGTLGFIFSSFFLGYSLSNFVGGWAADRIGAKRVFSMTMVLWSLFCELTAALTGFASLFVIRVIFGVGEGPLCSTMNKLLNNWFPHKESGTAIRFINCGTPLGGAIAGPLVGLIAPLGIIWLSFWTARVAERPAAHLPISAAEPNEVVSDYACSAEGPARPLGFYLRQLMVIATAAAGTLGLMAAAVFFPYLTGSTYWAIVQDAVRGKNVGGVGGFVHAIANCTGIIGPAVTGFIVQYSGGFTGTFVLAGGIAVVGVLAVSQLVRPIALGRMASPAVAAD